jgi:hypothetical protein
MTSRTMPGEQEQDRQDPSHSPHPADQERAADFDPFTPAAEGIYVMRPDGSDLTLIRTEGLPAEPEMPDWTA